MVPMQVDARSGRIRNLVIVSIVLVAIAVLWAFSDGSSNRGVGDELLRYSVADSFGGRSGTVIYIWEDSSFAEYWVVADRELDESALLAATPQHRGWLGEEMMGRLAEAGGQVLRGGVTQESKACERFQDDDHEFLTVSGVEYRVCRFRDGPIDEAMKVVEHILAIDVERPGHSVYDVLWDAQEALHRGGGLVVGKVAAVTVDGESGSVELTVGDVLVGQGETGKQVTVQGAGLSVLERQAVAGMARGDSVWALVGVDGVGRSLAGIDQSGQLAEWGPSTSPFALGHVAFLLAAHAHYQPSEARCVTHPAYGNVDPRLGQPGSALRAWLQDSLISGFEQTARLARRRANSEPAPPSAVLKLSGADAGVDYVIVEESGRLLQSVSGESTKLAGGRNVTIAPLPGVDVHIYAIDLSVTGCEVEGSKKGELLRRGYLSAALGELAVTFPARLFESRDEHDITIEVDLGTGMSWIDH